MGTENDEVQKDADLKDILRAIDGLENSETERIAILNISKLVETFSKRIQWIMKFQGNYPYSSEYELYGKERATWEKIVDDVFSKYLGTNTINSNKSETNGTKTAMEIVSTAKEVMRESGSPRTIMHIQFERLMEQLIELINFLSIEGRNMKYYAEKLDGNKTFESDNVGNTKKRYALADDYERLEKKYETLLERVMAKILNS